MCKEDFPLVPALFFCHACGSSEICVLMQLVPSGFNHQVILTRVPAMPEVWYVVDAAFGSRSPLEPIPLREPEDDECLGRYKSSLISDGQMC